MAESEKKGAKKERSERRKKKLEAQAKLNRVTLNFETDVRRLLTAEARKAGMGLTPFIYKILETHATDAAAADDPIRQRLVARRTVLNRAVELAREIDAEGGFDQDFILTVMKRAAQDAEFAGAYEAATAGTPKAAQRAKVALNRDLGRLIKQTVAAKSVRDDQGKIKRAQVQNEIITSYTLLKKAA